MISPMEETRLSLHFCAVLKSENGIIFLQCMVLLRSAREEVPGVCSDSCNRFLVPLGYY